MGLICKRHTKSLWLRMMLGACILISIGIVSLQFTDLFRSSTTISDPFSNNHVFNLRADKTSKEKLISSLTHQIHDLEQLLHSKQVQLKEAEKLNDKISKSHADENISVINIQSFSDGDQLAHFLSEKISNSIVSKPRVYRNEYELIPFTSFTRGAVYQLDEGLSGHPATLWGSLSDRKKELVYIVEEGAKALNKASLDGMWFTKDDFVEGLYRTQRDAGTQYELVYRRSISEISTILRKISLFRAFAPASPITETILDEEEIINIIVPLSGRLDTFKTFLENLKQEAIPDGHVFLTVVYFGKEDFEEVHAMLQRLQQETRFSAYKVVVETTKSFSRGLALHKGLISLTSANPLIFFCDVDVKFSREFLGKVRAYTVPERMVFYPIVFSLYNPSIVYEGKTAPSLNHQEIYKSQNGFWRDFGFGMACMYKNDYLAIGGFNLTIQGWGSEDVFLYRKYVRSPQYQVIRTPVSGLFHHWHPKNCDQTLPKEQYDACLRSKSMTEGSHTQIGTLYFRNQQK